MYGLGTFTRVARELRADLTAALERDPAARDVGRFEILLTYGGVQALLAQLSAQLLPGGAAGAAGVGVGIGVGVGAAAAAGSTPPSAPAPVAAPLQWIRAAHGEETRLIPIEEVIYFQSNDKYTSVFLAGGESLIRTPLRQLREQLDETNFWQIHRSVIVAARHVAGTKTDFRGRLMVQLKGRPEQLVVSRNYVDLFRQM